MAERMMGLVGAGGVSQSYLARVPALLRDLGPIKASTFQIARRISNSLRAGYAVSHYSALEPCAMIWIAVPEDTLDLTLHELVSQTPMNNTMVVLCDCARESAACPAFSRTNARLATLNLLQDASEHTFVAEGHPDCVKALRTILVSDRRKLVTLNPGAKPFFLAGANLAAPLLLPWIAGAMEAFRSAGFSHREAADAAEMLASQMLRSFTKFGHKAWTRSMAEELLQDMQRDVEQIRTVDPRLAALYEQGVLAALRILPRDKAQAAGAS